MTEKRRPNYRQVAKSVVQWGVGAIEEIKPTRRTIHRVVAELDDLGRGDLAEEVQRIYLRPRKTGTPPPQPGNVRDYSAQEQEGRVYGRVPLDTLGIRRKEKFRVTYGEDSIIIRRPW